MGSRRDCWLWAPEIFVCGVQKNFCLWGPEEFSFAGSGKMFVWGFRKKFRLPETFILTPSMSIHSHSHVSAWLPMKSSNQTSRPSFQSCFTSSSADPFSRAALKGTNSWDQHQPCKFLRFPAKESSSLVRSAFIKKSPSLV